jgi:preprotein translocase subunit SecE
VAQITPSGSTQSDAERPGITGVSGSVVERAAPEAEPSPEQPTEGSFVAATLAELRKVVWPSRQQLFSESVAVILMVGLSAAAIAALDRFYRWVSVQVFS